MLRPTGHLWVSELQSNSWTFGSTCNRIWNKTLNTHCLVDQGLSSNLPYLKYYTNLETTYTSPKNLEDVLTKEFHTSTTTKINAKSNNDPESRLGVYLQVNPNLAPPTHRDDILEFERVLLTRYRCGSHNLKIEVGRLCNPKIPREDRLCKCNNGVQSLRHCLFDCELLREVYEDHDYSTIEEAFNSPDIVNLLMKIGKVLNVSWYWCMVRGCDCLISLLWRVLIELFSEFTTSWTMPYQYF